MFNGMWAIAWLNHNENKFYLARDRVGIKPLYIKKGTHSISYGSEVKSILESSKEKFSINLQAIGEYLEQSLQDTSNNSFFDEIIALPAGHFLEVDLAGTELKYTLHKYWDPVISENELDLDEAVEEFKMLFDDAVKLRMRSDVPIGVTLSGGLDSSAIALVMQKGTPNQNFNILSVVSPGSKLDESPFIDIMTDHLGVQAHKVELSWSAEQTFDLLSTATYHNDSPIGSLSNVAHYLMMQKAHELDITVILSGQGADELLFGYKKYVGFYIQHLIGQHQYVKAAKTLLQFVVNKTVINQFSLAEAKRYIPFLSDKKREVMTDFLKSNYKPKYLQKKPSQSMNDRAWEDLNKLSVPYLTHYEDRMSMAWSREIRLPFLDYRIIEFLLRLKTDKKLYKGWTKYILRKAMEFDLPKEIVWRKDKQGFVNPQEEWLKGALREQVLNTFSENALIFKFNLLNRESLLKKYDDFCNNPSTSVWYREIFAPIALEVWLKINEKYIAET
jgi:asparagine synthase (glutamine-hydrolysing)